MKFTIQPVMTNTQLCKMRIGHLSELRRLPNTTFVTPLLLLYSKVGSVTHLTQEVLEMVTKMSSNVLQIPLSNSFQCYNPVKNFKDGISSFVGLSECLSYCTVQDPAEETKVGYNEKNIISIWTQTGRKLLSAGKYMDIMEAFRPDMYVALCDGDTNQSSSRKRAQKAVDVSTKMFTECVERHGKSESLRDSVLLAVLEGGYDLEARQRAAQLFSHHPQVRGFVIDGLHNNGASVEQMTFDTVEPVVTETLKHLPDDKLRIVHGSWTPEVVLELVRAGVDMFDSSLVYLVTERGCAFTFSYRVLQQEHNGVNLCNGDTNSCDKTKDLTEETNPTKTKDVDSGTVNSSYEINLKEKQYFDDLTPIMSQCSCLTCSKHSRAYIHHLLNTREMLASVLLMIHNLHHYQMFFQAIREHGKNGQLLTIDPATL